MAGVQISHNGMLLAEVFGGQSATLKCAGKKMVDDVVMAVPEQMSCNNSNINIVPLLVGEPGTYDANAPIIVTETFTGGGEPDAVMNFFGTSIPYLKAKKLVATKDIIGLIQNESFVDALYVVVYGETIPLRDMSPWVGNGYVGLQMDGVPAAIWLFTENGVECPPEQGWEVGGVYVMDAWSMGYTGEISISALGTPDKPADGFMPVNVVIPLEDELTVTASPYSYQTFGGDVYYRKVTVEPTPRQDLTITPTVQKQYFYPDEGKLFGNVTVEGVNLSELSNLKVPCGIYLDPIPQTDYVYGERLSTSGSYIAIMYTDGTTDKVNLLNTDVWGWDLVTSPGTYTLTVKYDKKNIHMQTTYRVKVTAP